MSSNITISVTTDMIKSLKKLVTEFGDIKNTARIIGVSPITLSGYLDNSKKVMSKNIWLYKISPFLQKKKSEIFNDLSTELINLRKIEEETWNLKSEIDFLKNEMNNMKNEYNEKIYRLVHSPFNIYFSEFSKNDGFYDYPILSDLQKLSNNEEVSLISLSIHMDEFRRLYELFRPNSISQNHPYWGTVKIMDAIFETLSRSFGMDLDYNYTKYGQSYITSLNRKKPIDYDINWKDLEEDVTSVSKLIDRAILTLLIESKEYFENRHILHYSHLVLTYIRRTYTDLDLSEIADLKIEPGKIMMKDKLIEFNNTHQLDRKLS